MAIPLSKGKLILLFSGAVAFVAVSYWLYGVTQETRQIVFFEAKAYAVAGMIFFGRQARS